MADLKTNYKDDVLDTSKNEKRKFRMIQNDDGTVSFEDATEYTQQGDAFGAADINATNAKINEQSQSLTNLYNRDIIGSLTNALDANNTVLIDLSQNITKFRDIIISVQYDTVFIPLMINANLLSGYITSKIVSRYSVYINANINGAIEIIGEKSKPTALTVRNLINGQIAAIKIYGA